MNENKYTNGKIYKISSLNTDKIYIGSTIMELNKRMSKHKSDYKNKTSHSSKEILLYENCIIELIEEFSCNSKKELEKREGDIILNYGELCVNKRIAGRTQKEYVNNNKEKINKYQKEYREMNKEKNKQYSIEYREKNKEYLLKKKLNIVKIIEKS